MIFTTVMLFKKNEIFTGTSVNLPGIIMGLSWGLGTVLFIAALQHAKLSVTVPLTSLYPALTVILAFIFLGERLQARELMGIMLAISAAILLAK